MVVTDEERDALLMGEDDEKGTLGSRYVMVLGQQRSTL
jgi:hypothetical protein